MTLKQLADELRLMFNPHNAKSINYETGELTPIDEIDDIHLVVATFGTLGREGAIPPDTAARKLFETMKIADNALELVELLRVQPLSPEEAEKFLKELEGM